MPSHKKQLHHHHHHARPSIPAVATGDDGNADVFVDANDEVSKHSDLDPQHADTKDDHFNEEVGAGHHHHHEDHHHQFEDMSVDDKIANLKELNETLVKQVCSSRTAVVELEEKVKALQEQVQENATKVDKLAIDKSLLEEQKHELELQIAASKEEVGSLGADNANLVAEKETLIGQKRTLQLSLSETEARRKDVKEQLEETHRALMAAKQDAEVLNVEAARLSKEEEELSGTSRALQSSKQEAQSALNELQERKTCLEEKLNCCMASVASAESQISDSNKVIASLQDELLARSREREGFEMQLQEAWQQIATLEARREEWIARENTLQAQLERLEYEVSHVRMEHENASVSVKQEMEDITLLQSELEVISSKNRELELSLESSKRSMSKLEDDSAKDQQRVCSLENELEMLTKEKASLAEFNTALEEELRALNLGSIKASSEAKDEIENLKSTMSSLENSLAEAKDNSLVHDKNVTQLECNIRELNFQMKRRDNLTKMSLPLAIASSTSLIVLGFSAFLKQARHHC